MTKDQAVTEAKKYNGFVNRKFLNIATRKVYIVTRVEANVVTGNISKYQVLVSFKSIINDEMDRSLVENIDIFLEHYAMI